MKRIGVLLILMVLGAAGPLCAQAGGALTGSIEGRVSLVGTTVPGVLVTIESPTLQGKRSVVTGPNGDFIFRQLPPGSYTIHYSLSGAKQQQRALVLSLGDTSRQDANLDVASAATEVVVSGSSIAADEEKAAVHGATFRAADVSTLPVARNLSAIAANTPGVTSRSTPNAGQLSISGGFAYDNRFLLNGVDIGDNLFGSATNQVVIEEAVQETQVMTSNISAEFGGFSGGVVNAITKSGGNSLSGSARVDLSNPNWQAYTPIEAQNQTSRPSNLSEFYTATLGGKLVEDRLWYFLAGRFADQSLPLTLPVTNEAVNTTLREPRLEAKLTGNVNESHTLQVDYTYSKRTTTNNPTIQIVGEATAVQSPTYPSSVVVASYNGVFSPSLVGALQYSEKKFQYSNAGGSGTDLVSDSPFLSAASGTQPFIAYNAPYFDSSDPENRDNRDIAGSLSYYLAAGSLGSHDLKAGFDVFQTIHDGGNSQSPTSYVFYADYKTDAAGNPVYGPSPRGSNQLIPIFRPGVSQAANYLATRGAQTNIRTNAFYLNDSVRLGRFAFNLGVRYETVHGTGPDGATITDTHALVPRLGATWDVKGDGRFRVSGSYAQYAGKYNDGQFGQGTAVGNPNGIYQIYTGPAGEGYGFAPGFDPKNYSTFNVNFPLANVFFPDSVTAPLTTEYTLSVGGNVTRTLSAAATFISRNTRSFVEDFIDDPSAAGKTDVVYQGVDYGTFDNRRFANSDVPRRRYQALQLQAAFSGLPNLLLQANYTYQLKFEGTIEGEAANAPGISSVYGNYPEIAALDRTAPYGNLTSYQKHKLRMLGSYRIATPIGAFTPGVIYSYDSGAPYNLTSSVDYTGIQLARDPGYASLPARQTIFFGGRGENFFPSQQQWDLSLGWDAPLFKAVAPYVRVAVTNVFNTHYLVSFNTSVRPNTAGPLDANGLPTTYIKGASFGQATNSTDYQAARIVTAAAGIRF